MASRRLERLASSSSAEPDEDGHEDAGDELTDLVGAAVLGLHEVRARQPCRSERAADGQRRRPTPRRSAALP